MRIPRALIIGGTIAVAVFGVAFIAARILELPARSYRDEMPSWFRGPFQSVEGDLKIHFLYGGKVWFTHKDRYEELTWVLDGKRAKVVRRSSDYEEEVGYVVAGGRDWTIEWRDAKQPDRSIVLEQVKRQGD